MTKQQKITLSASRDIPFNKLMLSQSNVRHVKAGVSIEELAEDIARRTLLSSITVRPVLDDSGADTGMYTIPAGGRRFRALELLVKQKRMNKTALVPCIVRTNGLAEEDSLAENVQRAPLHPLDQFRALGTVAMIPVPSNTRVWLTATKILWGQILAVFLIVLTTTWGATQWVAWRLGFQAQLGSPWFEAFGMPIYPPPAFFWWWYFYDAYARTVFWEGGAIAASGGFISIAVAITMSFATNDERTAKRVSDALGTATEMKAMRNYAGHRLAPWLGHLMVSRSETARQLLTPGEIMQLPPDDEIVMVAGSPPIRAKKARYFEDKRFVDRVVAPPAPQQGTPMLQDDPWSSLSTIETVTTAGKTVPSADADEANVGLRREPDLAEHVAVAPEKTAKPAREFEMMLDDEPEEAARQRQALQKQMGQVARQASMDRNDGIDL
jgi:hypothetical protein